MGNEYSCTFEDAHTDEALAFVAKVWDRYLDNFSYEIEKKIAKMLAVIELHYDEHDNDNGSRRKFKAYISCKLKECRDEGIECVYDNHTCDDDDVCDCNQIMFISHKGGYNGFSRSCESMKDEMDE
jgi:hypothetical protein